MPCYTQVKHCNVMLKTVFDSPLITQEYAWRIIRERCAQQNVKAYPDIQRINHHNVTVHIIYSMQINKQRMALELRGALMWKGLQFLVLM